MTQSPRPSYVKKRLVVLESPYAGDIERNTAYARACVNDCVHRGEAVQVSHLLYTLPGILNDNSPEERQLGMECGWAWMRVAEAVVVYSDFGISPGMALGITHALSLGLLIEYRVLSDKLWAPFK
jgi:hypothetical protein